MDIVVHLHDFCIMYFVDEDKVVDKMNGRGLHYTISRHLVQSFH